MRRKEFNVDDKSKLLEFLEDQEFGTLCIFDEPYPYAVPLNFVYFEDKIYFHGATSGRKYELAKNKVNCSFSVVKPFSLLPSYFFDSEFACFATQFFASAFFEGHVCLVEDTNIKAQVLQAMMEKLQHEESFLNIVENIKKHEESLKKVAIYEFEFTSWSLKIKAGQNLTPNKKENLIKKLHDRGDKMDKTTIENIKKYM